VVTRTALAFPTLLGYVLLLEALHWATGGGIFSDPQLVRTITVIVFVAAIILWVVQIRAASAHGHSIERSSSRWAYSC
jgi:hypothetical protein